MIISKDPEPKPKRKAIIHITQKLDAKERPKPETERINIPMMETVASEFLVILLSKKPVTTVLQALTKGRIDAITHMNTKVEDALLTTLCLPLNRKDLNQQKTHKYSTVEVLPLNTPLAQN